MLLGENDKQSVLWQKPLLLGTSYQLRLGPSLFLTTVKMADRNVVLDQIEPLLFL